MPLTTQQLHTVAKATVSDDHRARAVALESIGNPDAVELAADAHAHLDSDNRNDRVAALRVLAWCDGPDAITGLLRGLDDPVKRVREVAAKSTPRFLDDQRIVARLTRAVERDESGSAGPAALILGGIYHAPYGLTAREPIVDVMRTLVEIPKHRQLVLGALLHSRTLTEDIEALLRDVVTYGTKEEAVAATRRLCGYRVAHHGELDSETRRQADRAWGDVYYWIRADD